MFANVDQILPGITRRSVLELASQLPNLEVEETAITLPQVMTCSAQGGITCGTIDEPRKSSKAIDERVIIDFRDKNVIIARFSDKNGGFLFYR